jgi:hypothetical protein
MDSAERYARQENVSRFLQFLEYEYDAERSRYWTKLLVAEADEFGHLSERLNIMQTCLDRCAQRIVQQRALMDGNSFSCPRDSEMANKLLANLIEIHATLKAHRDILESEANR